MIVINYGSDAFNTTYGALEASDIRAFLETGMAVAIKPNLVVPSPAFSGATTHPEVVDALISFLKDFGITRMRIIESSWHGGCTKKAYKYCGYEELSAKHGVPLIDLKDDSHTTLVFEGTKVAICDEALNADFLINMPVLKGHSQTRLTCCLKNLKGCIPDSDKRRFHSIGLHKPIAVLNKLLKTGYCVVDGICGDLSFEEGGNPVESGRIIAGRNPVTIDSLCAELIGRRPDEIEHLKYARDLGLGEFHSQNTEIIELNARNKPAHTIGGGRSAEKYSHLIDEDSACSPCYSSLVYALHRLGDAGFGGNPAKDGSTERGDGKNRTSGKIHIGQGFKGKSGEGIGVGNCTAGFTRCVKGCPPKATEILETLSLAFPSGDE